MKRGRPKNKDPQRGTRLNHAHYNMIDRCTNPQSKDYPNYGGRGIEVCPQFIDFANYRNWFRRTFQVADIPPGLTIDRIDNNGNYEPGNLRLATNSEQANNRRSNKLIEYNGETRNVAQWAEKTGIPRKTLEKRLRKPHWSIEKCLTAPVNDHLRMIEYKGETKSALQWSKETGIGYTTILDRVNKGWKVEDALTVTPWKK